MLESEHFQFYRSLSINVRAQVSYRPSTSSALTITIRFIPRRCSSGWVVRADLSDLCLAAKCKFPFYLSLRACKTLSFNNRKSRNNEKASGESFLLFSPPNPLLRHPLIDFIRRRYTALNEGITLDTKNEPSNVIRNNFASFCCANLSLRQEKVLL